MDRYAEAIERFKQLLAQAQKSRLKEPTACVLATADRRGKPSSRTVLLKRVDSQGFVFYTNLQSRKGRELVSNPRASLCFYWEPLEVQVVAEGGVKPVSTREADAYWRTRPRESQLGAWASQQSRPLKSRKILVARFAEAARRFAGGEIPRPSFWTGFRVVPDRIEFWRRRPSRLHERELYVKKARRWRKILLYP